MRLGNNLKVEIIKGRYKGMEGRMEMPKSFGGRHGLTIFVKLDNGDKISFKQGMWRNIDNEYCIYKKADQENQRLAASAISEAKRKAIKAESEKVLPNNDEN